MIHIFTAGQSRDIDALTIAREPVSPIDLVERAAKAFAAEFADRFDSTRRVIVFAGQGNNGADALAIARILAAEHNFAVEAYLLNPTGKLSAECETNRRRILQINRHILIEVTAGNKFYPPELGEGDIVVDGLFGSGLNRPLEGGYVSVVKYINASAATVVSVDIPSGLFGEDNSGNNPEAIIRSDLTLAFGCPSLVFLLAESAPYVRKWKVLDIGWQDASDTVQTALRLIEEEDAARLLRPRMRFAHKGNFGHGLLVAGSRGKIGAAVLAAGACLRAGAGLITVHLPACGETVLHTAFPEAMISPDDKAGHVGASEIDGAAFSAICVGPGIGMHPDTAQALESLLGGNRPVVLDADALNIIAAHGDLMSRVPARSILTPHPKEFDRLAGSESNNGYERLQKAMAFAVEHSVILVLKGAYTAVCLPDGQVRFNSSGNPGMATAGSGDVLAGLLLGLLCTGYSPEDAATLGVFLHGMAGDLAAASSGEEAMIASDIINHIGKAFRLLKN
ncbi:MAG: NAD(P)H-hydrate dehydratase [Tannerellaceae bacterium]|jgi:NAD(P)H-hydrate epimerase|nr:NAD(P)H-hydrate dehydratase [Tannerellaceae bacterium]